MTDSTQLDIGVSENSDVHAEADVYAHVDDGEHAIVWAVERTGEYEVRVTAWLCENGLIERDGPFGVKYFGVDPVDETDSWALDYAKGHAGSIEHARAHFEN